MGEEFKILAEHFADKDNIDVIIKGDEAKTDANSKTIYLPEDVPDEMFGVTLATLLHESHHIKLSKGLPAATPENKASAYFHLLNALEDIRIDTKVIDKYPNAKGLYSELLKYIDKKYGAEYAKLPKEARIVRESILRSYGHNNVFDEHKDKTPEVQDFFTRNGTKIDNLINRVKMCRNVQQLDPLVDEFGKLVFEDDEKEFEKLKQQADQQSGGAMSDYSQASSEYSNAAGEYQKAAQAEQTINKQGNAAINDAKYWAEIAKAHLKRSTAADKAKAEDAEKNKENAIKQAENAKQRLDQLKNNTDVKSLGQKFTDASRKLREAQQKADAVKAQIKAMAAQKSIAMGKKLTGMDKFAISFGNIDKEDFKTEFKINQTLEERLLEYLKNKQERRVVLDDGKIVTNKLPTFYDALSLFEQKPDDLQKKTRIFFVVDRSGSMSYGGKYATVLTALNNICTVVDRGVSQYGMDIEYSIYGFDTQTQLVKDFEKQAFDPVAAAAGLSPRGGTDPIDTLKTIEGVYCDQPNTKEIVFFLTDGDMGHDAYEYIKQQMGGKKKWVFLGVDITDGNAESKRLFGNYNIRHSKEIQKVLTKAIEDTL
jgi:hypothetical protein